MNKGPPLDEPIVSRRFSLTADECAEIGYGELGSPARLVGCAIYLSLAFILGLLSGKVGIQLWFIPVPLVMILAALVRQASLRARLRAAALEGLLPIQAYRTLTVDGSGCRIELWDEQVELGWEEMKSIGRVSGGWAAQFVFVRDEQDFWMCEMFLGRVFDPEDWRFLDAWLNAHFDEQNNRRVLRPRKLLLAGSALAGLGYAAILYAIWQPHRQVSLLESAKNAGVGFLIFVIVIPLFWFLFGGKR